MRVHHPKRLAVGGLLLVAVAAAIGIGRANPTPAATAPGGLPQPNIVLIQTDDQTLSQLTTQVMPNTERLLVQHGTIFINYVVTTAQCCPSRASLLTGQYAHDHGVTSNNIAYPGLIDKDNVLPAWLQREGYRTMHVGKFLNGYEKVADSGEVAPGWDQWDTVTGPTRYYDYNWYVNGKVTHRGSASRDQITGLTNRSAVRLVDKYGPRRRPFYLQVDEPAPHGSRHRDPAGPCDRAPMPQPADEGRWSNATLPRPPSFNEPDMRDKPAFLSGRPKLSPSDLSKVTKRWRCALAALTSVDRGVQNIYEAVKRAGEIHRTVFLFISDNGKFFGEHRIGGGKVFPYEEAINLPLVIRMPGRYRDGVPRVKRSDRPVANIDLAPTILALAHAQPCTADGRCRTMDGRSLMPILSRSGGTSRSRGILTEYKVPHHRSGHYATCNFAGIRTRNTIYVEHYAIAPPGSRHCEPARANELYDLKTDPFELHNRCFGGLPSSCPTSQYQQELRARLLRLENCAGIEGRDEPVDGRPFCE